jgi:hypothetical protein
VLYLRTETIIPQSLPNVRLQKKMQQWNVDSNIGLTDHEISCENPRSWSQGFGIIHCSKVRSGCRCQDDPSGSDTTSTIVSKSIINMVCSNIPWPGFSAVMQMVQINIKWYAHYGQQPLDTIPYNEIMNDNITLKAQATVSRYLSSCSIWPWPDRCWSDSNDRNGFIEPFTKSCRWNMR